MIAHAPEPWLARRLGLPVLRLRVALKCPALDAELAAGAESILSIQN